jgi:hypothetical protein
MNLATLNAHYSNEFIEDLDYQCWLIKRSNRVSAWSNMRIVGNSNDIYWQKFLIFVQCLLMLIVLVARFINISEKLLLCNSSFITEWLLILVALAFLLKKIDLVWKVVPSVWTRASHSPNLDHCLKLPEERTLRPEITIRLWLAQPLAFFMSYLRRAQTKTLFSWI